ncbi:MAG: hypothetical protein AB2A00_39475, partial [Myxococcota bacterium]
MARRRATGSGRAWLASRTGSVRAGMDPQTIRVLALLASPQERRRWRWQLRMAPAGQRAAAATALGAAM